MPVEEKAMTTDKVLKLFGDVFQKSGTPKQYEGDRGGQVRIITNGQYGRKYLLPEVTINHMNYFFAEGECEAGLVFNVEGDVHLWRPHTQKSTLKPLRYVVALVCLCKLAKDKSGLNIFTKQWLLECNEGEPIEIQDIKFLDSEEDIPQV